MAQQAQYSANSPGQNMRGRTTMETLIDDKAIVHCDRTLVSNVPRVAVCDTLSFPAKP